MGICRTKKTNCIPFSAKFRLRFLVGILCLILLGLIARLIDLTIIKRKFLRDRGDARTVRQQVIPAHRGMILDRQGEAVAISSPVKEVWIDASRFKPNSRQLQALSALLQVLLTHLKKQVQQAKNKEFFYLKRGLSPQLAAKIKKLKIPGLFLQEAYHRYYPQAAVMAHVLGRTNIDDKGQEGLELAYNDWLEGRPGSKKVIKDRLGDIVAEVGHLVAPQPGHDLQISLDLKLQYIAYQALESGVRKYQADAGSIIVLDVVTGEILAMVNWPSYNPNDRIQLQKGDGGRYRNRALTDLFEPGSTIKSFSMASVLASGRFTPHTQIDTSPGWMIISGKRIMDEKNNGVMDLTKILQISSNMGMSKLVLSLPPENLWQTLHAVGLGQITDSHFPGERSGQLPHYKIWNPFVLATLSFGYGLSVTALQLAQAYAVLAHHGVKIPVSFLKVQGTPPQGQTVLKPQVCQQVLDMLESVLAKGGTAPLASVPGYRVTGKTGTTRIVGTHGYEKHHYNSFFIGIAPASRPRLVVAVVLHNPKGKKYYGGYTAGPIFSQVMRHALHLLNVPPDDISSFNQTS